MNTASLLASGRLRVRLAARPQAFLPSPVTRVPSRIRMLSTAETAIPVVPQQSRWRRFLQTLGRVTLITIVTAAGTFYYVSYKNRTPGAQQPFDPEKKTIVVLGSGWGATSLLKTLDNEDYNVVCNHFLSFCCLWPQGIYYCITPGRYQSSKLFPIHASFALRGYWHARCSFYHPAYPLYYPPQKTGHPRL